MTKLETYLINSASNISATNSHSCSESLAVENMRRRDLVASLEAARINAKTNVARAILSQAEDSVRKNSDMERFSLAG